MREVIEELLKQENTRQNLSRLRSLIKEHECKVQAYELLKEHDDLLISFLASEDAKTRKNAALLIGDLQISHLADDLFKAYESENTRFVKSSYLTALLQLDIPQLVPKLVDKKKLLEHTEITEENRKHVDEELREINKILIKYNGIKQHTPILEGVRAELLLTTNKLHREIVRRQLPVKETKLHPLGVIVKTDNIRLIMKVRTYRQMYFMINTEGLLSGDEREMASQLWKSDMYDILRRMHREPGPFYYRIESSADGEFQSRLSAALDRLSGGKLINSANNYEIVIKLIQTRDGSYFPCLRLCSVKDDRFIVKMFCPHQFIHQQQHFW